jgi:hypothetical protein
MDESTINDFTYQLSYKSWENVFSNNDIDLMFNSFLDTFFILVSPSQELKLEIMDVTG